MHNIFYISLLEQNITRKEQVDKQVIKLEIEAGNSKEYEIKAICNRTIYIYKAKSYLPGLYNLIMWRKYSKIENTWELSFAVYHLEKFINFFHKDHLEKPTATFSFINFALLMTRLTVKPTSLKLKQWQLADGASK